mgnify:CR=1 FL=1
MLTGVGKSLQSVKGLFGGIGYTIFGGELMTEWDGSDLNAGYRYQLDKHNEVFIAWTDIFHEDSDKAGVDQPARTITVGFSIRHNRNRILEQQIAERKRLLKKLEKHTTELENKFVELDKRLDERFEKNDNSLITHVYNYEELTNAYNDLFNDYESLKINYQILNVNALELQEIKKKLETYKVKTEKEIYDLKTKNIHFMLDLNSVSDKYFKRYSDYKFPDAGQTKYLDYTEYRKQMEARKIKQKKNIKKEFKKAVEDSRKQ